MPAPNASAVTVPGRLKIYVAPVGTTAPADESAAPAAAWVDQGYTTEDGSRFATDPSYEEVRAHQSDFPIRVMKATDSAVAGFTMLEWTTASFTTAFGGGTVTQVTAGHMRYDPPDVSTPVAVIIEATDGTRKFRLLIPKCRARSGVELTFAKTGATALPIELAVEGQDGVKPWYMLNNDVAAFVVTP